MTPVDILIEIGHLQTNYSCCGWHSYKDWWNGTVEFPAVKIVSHITVGHTRPYFSISICMVTVTVYGTQEVDAQLHYGIIVYV